MADSPTFSSVSTSGIHLLYDMTESQLWKGGRETCELLTVF